MSSGSFWSLIRTSNLNRTYPKYNTTRKFKECQNTNTIEGNLLDPFRQVHVRFNNSYYYKIVVILRNFKVNLRIFMVLLKKLGLPLTWLKLNPSCS